MKASICTLSARALIGDRTCKHVFAPSSDKSHRDHEGLQCEMMLIDKLHRTHIVWCKIYGHRKPVWQTRSDQYCSSKSYPLSKHEFWLTLYNSPVYSVFTQGHVHAHTYSYCKYWTISSTKSPSMLEFMPTNLMEMFIKMICSCYPQVHASFKCANYSSTLHSSAKVFQNIGGRGSSKCWRIQGV